MRFGQIAICVAAVAAGLCIGCIPASADLIALTAPLPGTVGGSSVSDINSITGVVTPLGSSPAPGYGLDGDFTTLVTAPGGTHAYFPIGTTGRNNGFYSFDLTTGMLTSVLTPSNTLVGGLGWDPVHNQLLGLTAPLPGTVGGSSVSDINPITGVVTPLGSSPAPGYGLDGDFTTLVTALGDTHAYFPIGTTGRNNGFYSFDLTTGMLTSVLTTPSNTLVGGLGEVSQATSVPEPNSIWLLLLGVGTMLLLRHRVGRC
jgi:hypothetical protein